MVRKKNYDKSQPTSFVPRFSAQSEVERQKIIMERVGKGRYYANKKRYMNSAGYTGAPKDYIPAEEREGFDESMVEVLDPVEE